MFLSTGHHYELESCSRCCIFLQPVRDKLKEVVWNYYSTGDFSEVRKWRDFLESNGFSRVEAGEIIITLANEEAPKILTEARKFYWVRPIHDRPFLHCRFAVPI